MVGKRHGAFERLYSSKTLLLKTATEEETIRFLKLSIETLFLLQSLGLCLVTPTREEMSRVLPRIEAKFCKKFCFSVLTTMQNKLSLQNTNMSS